ncbi:DeoR/GlpR family transcriptional regulator of sugar metabolism [Neorhizobium huautlense]|uniref:DeoR/GlpR family transcriptional regulator of sugar metabolism n=1 Tax=Neorhizobium huautlense TaxID=67774 RepID=A0ABT9Q0B1_9HYPH|nr:DeoR/GlpR family DNA-binding transcription regulator [Neorhizobium huautlense]MDP9840162.1 DeoR/GlpR family transcriptional regulator of sugar metabolism [Neorhizobium huautlense]
MFMTTSLSISRRDIIEARLAKGQEIVASAVAIEFDISEDAVRRDLRALAAEGKCRRVYGGALPLVTPSRPIAERIGQASERKTALARVAAGTVAAGELLFLDCGSTNLAMAALLPGDQKLTVATNSIDIAAAIIKRGDIPLILIGGVVDPVVGGSVDASAIARLDELNIDRCFVGACAVSAETGPKGGMSVQEHADAIFKRKLMTRSAINIVLATSEKFEERAPHRIGYAKDIDWLIVEDDLAADTKQALTNAGYAMLTPGQSAA